MGRAITLELSEEEYSRAEKLAAAARADVNSVLTLVLRHGLPEHPEPMALDELAGLHDRELEARARGSFSGQRRAAFDRLRRKQQEGPLRSREAEQLEALLGEYQQAELDMARAQAVLAIRRQFGTIGEP